MAIAIEATAPDPLGRRADFWWLWLVSGLLWIVVALVVLQFDQASVRTVGVVIGLMFLVAGAQSLFFGGLGRGGRRWIDWVFGVLLLIAGVISLIQPEATFAGVADILGFLFLVVGVNWLVQALEERGQNRYWWFGLLAGIAMVIVAFWTSGQFFVHKQYVLLVFAGIWSLFHGVGDLLEAFHIRDLRTAPRRAQR
jgi:uncharacterized membrane protein HdeD (DUF308 family)